MRQKLFSDLTDYYTLQTKEEPPKVTVPDSALLQEID